MARGIGVYVVDCRVKATGEHRIKVFDTEEEAVRYADEMKWGADLDVNWWKM